MATLVLAGCSASPVAVPDPDLPRDLDAACRELLAALPDTVGDHERAEVSPDDALGAAWGDPPIVLSCGSEVPEGFDDTSFCQEVNGVGWYVPDVALQDEALDVTLVTVGYRPVVTVVVPAELRPEGVATASATLAGPVAEHTEEVRPCR